MSSLTGVALFGSPSPARPPSLPINHPRGSSQSVSHSICLYAGCLSPTFPEPINMPLWCLFSSVSPSVSFCWLHNINIHLGLRRALKPVKMEGMGTRILSPIQFIIMFSKGLVSFFYLFSFFVFKIQRNENRSPLFAHIFPRVYQWATFV